MMEMPKPNNLAGLLYLNLEGDVFEEVWGVLKPFFGHIHSKKYNLAKQNNVDTHEIRKAIALGIKPAEDTISFLSLQKPFLTDFNTPNKIGFCRYFEDAMGIKHIGHNNFEEDLKCALLKPALAYEMENRLNDLWDFVETDIVNGLLNCIKRTLEENLSEDNDSLKKSIWIRTSFIFSTVIFYYLGLILTNKKERADNLKPLLVLLPTCIPLLKLKHQECGWILLVA